MFDQEGGEGVSVVGSVLLSLAQAVNQDDGEAVGDFPLLVQLTERLEDALIESLARVGVTAVDVELLPDVLVRLEEVVVGGQLGGLAQLGRHGVDELRHQTGGRVVGLTEVVGHHLGRQGAQLVLLLPPFLPVTSRITEAASVHEGEKERSLASARAPCDDHPPVGGQVGQERLLHVLPEPVSAHQRLSGVASNLKVKRLRQRDCVGRGGLAHSQTGPAPAGHLLPPPGQSVSGGAAAGGGAVSADHLQSGPLVLGPGQAGLQTDLARGGWCLDWVRETSTGTWTL